jgi:outer membrane protein assembly factor BamB/tRNA A-37 threonylcarbamoyl transferase component Bud32
MSTVYRARDLRFSVVKTVAVKEMINRAHDDYLRDAAVSIFEREANLLASLHHPSIPRIFDYFSIGTQSYLVMEFIEGYNLETIVNQSQEFLPETQVVSWIINLCDVLEYLHNHKPQPIIFRDIKPANIVITPDNRVVLVDFGIAKAFQVGQKGTMIGTEGYSPPEQYRGEATPAVDIYALGATLHHVLTKKDPRVETPFTFSERPIRQINPKVSIELESIINTALQYNAADRFPDAETMKNAIISLARETHGLSEIGNTEAISLDQSITPLWIFECEDEIRGTATYDDQVIYIGTYDNNLYAIDSATGEFIWKYPTDGGIVSTPTVYEKNIYFGSEDERLHVISPHSGRVVWTYYTEGPIRSSPFIADRHVFIGSDDSHLHIVNAVTGRRALKVDLGAPIRSRPLVAGENVYLGTESGEFFCLDFRGRIKWRVRAKRAITSSPTLANDTIFFGSVDGTLYAVDAKTGWSIWRFRMGRGTISSPHVTEHLIVIGSADNNIYCIDTRSSKEIWRFETNHQVSSSPLIYQGAVFFGGVDGYIYCLDMKNGRLRWKFETEGAVTSSPIIHDDTVFIGSTDHRIYALPA